MTDAPTPDDFEAAKKVFDELKDLTTERQERVLRWVSETLGVKSFATTALPGSAPVQVAISPTAANPTGSMPRPSGGGRDIRTFVAEKAPSSDNQFAAVVAYYYRFEAPPEQRHNSISGADLQEAARLAGRKRLANPRQALQNARALGYLDNPARGEFSINTVGENLVAMTLPGGVDSTARRGAKRGAKKSNAGARRKTRKR
jgi:hypothetical protein